mgnify:CR=1 FL=1
MAAEFEVELSRTLIRDLRRLWKRREDGVLALKEDLAEELKLWKEDFERYLEVLLEALRGEAEISCPALVQLYDDCEALLKRGLVEELKPDRRAQLINDLKSVLKRRGWDPRLCPPLPPDMAEGLERMIAHLSPAHQKIIRNRARRLFATGECPDVLTGALAAVKHKPQFVPVSQKRVEWI